MIWRVLHTPIAENMLLTAMAVRRTAMTGLRPNS